MTITTGLKTLDRILAAPLRPGTLTLYCGQPGSGMTTMLDTAAVANGLDAAVPTLLCDSETSRRAHADRIMSAKSGVPLVNIQRGNLSGLEMARIAATKAATKASPLTMSDAKSVDALIEDIDITRARLVLVDGSRYLGYTANYEPDHDTQIMSGLKEVAQDRQVAIIATSPVLRTGSRPDLSSVKEGLTLVADVIVLLHRLEPAGPEEASRSTVVELSVVKNRHGGTGRCEGAAQYTHARFIDIPHSGSRAA